MKVKYYYSVEWQISLRLWKILRYLCVRVCNDNERFIPFFSGLQNQKRNWRTRGPAGSNERKSNAKNIYRANWFLFNHGKKILSEMNVFAISRWKSFSIRGIWFDAFRVCAVCANISRKRNRIKGVQTVCNPRDFDAGSAIVRKIFGKYSTLWRYSVVSSRKIPACHLYRFVMIW